MDNYFSDNGSLDAWHLKRRGKFTSSENHKLIKPGEKGNVFSIGGITYIETKAVEMITEIWERPELEEVESLRWGKGFELPAFEDYISKTKNYGMEFMGTENPVFMEYEEGNLKEESGGSPDGVFRDSSGIVLSGLELKCPKNPLFQFRRLSWKDQFDIKEKYMLVYCQIQHLLMINKSAKEWHFYSYDERIKHKNGRGKLIVVYPDKKFQDNLYLRLEIAVREKYKLLANQFKDDTIKDYDSLRMAIK